MKEKTWKWISPVVIFGISALLHFGYDVWPNFVTSLLFPVNESIWEHNKIIFGSFFIWMLIDKFFYKKKLSITASIIAAISCSFLVMLIFTPVFFFLLNKQENMIVTFIIYFLCIAGAQIIYFILQKKDSVGRFNTIGLILWIFIWAINAYFTYYPLKTGLFYDYQHSVYGIYQK